MKKTWVVYAVIILLVQYFSPLITVVHAVSEDTAINGIELAAVVISPTKDTEVNQQVNMMLKGRTQTASAYNSLLNVKGIHFPTAISGNILTDTANIIGTFNGSGSSLTLNFTELGNEVFYLESMAELTGITSATHEVSVSSLTETQLTTINITSILNNESVDKSVTTEIEAEEDITEELIPPTIESNNSESSEVGESEESNHVVTKSKMTAKREPININTLFEEIKPTQFFVRVKIVDEKGNEITDTSKVKIGDPIHFTFAFQLPESIRQQMEPGDFVTAQLPDVIKIVTPITQELFGPNGEKYGDLIISTSGEIKITFNEKIKEESQIEGTVHVGGKLQQGDIDNPGEHTIKFPFVEASPEIPIIVQPSSAKDISKSGHLNTSLNPDKVSWDVDINLGLNDLTNAKVTEKFPSGTEFESLEVYSVDVDFNGKVIPGSERPVPKSEYDVDSQGNVTFKNPINSAYRLTYTTKITNPPGDEGGQLTFKNEATLSADELPKESTATSTIKATYNKKLEKTKPSYDKNKQEFSWTINYNFNETPIAPGKASITDSFNSEMQLVDDSIVVYPVTIDPITGKATEDRDNPFKEGIDYTLTERPDGKGFMIEFKDGLDHAVAIHYKTKVTEEVTSSNDYENSVTDGEGNTDINQGSAKQQGLIKSMNDVDYENKIFSWKIEVNNNHYKMTNWKLTDILSPGLTLIEDSFDILNTTTNQQLTKDQDFTLTYTEGVPTLNSTITVNLINQYVQTNDSFIITYKTSFDTAELNEAGLDEFTNKASSDWLSESKEELEIESEVGFVPDDKEQADGFKSGEYNALTKSITWEVGINYNRQNLGDVTITDPITGNQKYIPNSVNVYRYTIGKDGSITRGELVSQSEYSVVEPTVEKNEIELSFNDVGPLDQYLFTFETSLEGVLVNDAQTYHNKAVVDAENVSGSFKIEGDVSIENGGKMLEKTGEQNSEDGRLDWKATINASQSTIHNPVITDTPSTNQIIDEASIVVYETVVAEDGKLTKGEVLAPTEYTVNLSTDNNTGAQQLILTFNAGVIERAYILEYSALLLFDKPGAAIATNDIVLTGDEGLVFLNEGSGEAKIESSTGGGSIVGVKGQLAIRKIDGKDTTKTLAGARFELWDKNNRQKLREGYVNLKGEIIFGSLPHGDYLLKETRAPLGYSIPDDLISGRKVVIDANSSKENVYLEVPNNPTHVTLTKVGPDRINPSKEVGLTGATYKLQMKFGPTWLDIKTAKTLVTDENGKLILENLIVGTYRLVETKAPDGYILDSEPLEFKMVRDSEGRVVIVGDDPVHRNKLGEFEITKIDGETKTPLTGAEFEITRVRDASGNLINEKLQGTFKSTVDGKLILKNLPTGHYVVKETIAPEGYLINSQLLEFDIFEDPIKNSQHESLTFNNYQGSISFTKKAAYDELGASNLITGAKFTIVSKDGTVMKEAISDSQGTVSFKGLAPGEYTLTEVEPGKDQTGQEYITNTEPVSFTINKDALGKPDVLELADFINYLGSVALAKVNTAGERLPGAEFTLYLADDTTNSDALGTFTTNDLGVITVEKLSPGRYKLIETKAPPLTVNTQYIKNEYPVFFEIEAKQAGEVELKNLGNFQNFKARAVISKVSGESQNLALSGAEFDVYKIVDGEEIKTMTVTSSTDGSLTIDNLGPGNYKMIEIKAPARHVINSQPIYITISENSEEDPTNTDEFKYENYKQKIVFDKVNEDKALISGATFNIFQVDEQGNKLTNTPINDLPLTSTDGHYEYEGIEVGSYLLEEVTPVPGYLLNTTPVYFEVKPVIGDPEDIKLADFINYQGSATIRKVDQEGQVLKEAVFTLTSKDQEAVSTVTTIDGVATFTGLAPGVYILEESKAPAGYLINTEEINVTIPTEAAGVPEVIDLAEFINYQGSLIVTKTDEEGHLLANAEFSLYDEKSGLEISKAISNEEGLIEINNLAPGEYLLKEIKAPQGFILNKTVIPVTITDSDVGMPEVVTLGEFTNYQGSVSFTKQTESGSPLAGAEFSLFDQQEKKIGDSQSNNEGEVKFKHLAPGKYTIKETKAAPGYILNTESLTFEIEESFTPTETQVTPPTVILKEFINYQGTTELTKVDAGNVKKVLAGAEFKLVDQIGQEVVKHLVSNENGQVQVTDLAPGIYYFIETKAPQGYELTEERVEVVIADTEKGKPQPVKVHLANKQVEVSPKTPTKPNKPGNLPVTSNSNNTGLIVIGSFLLIAMLIFIEKRRYVPRHKE